MKNIYSLQHCLMDVSLKLFVLVDLGIKTKHSALTESLIQSSHDILLSH
jgi:hypothetical protein